MSTRHVAVDPAHPDLMRAREALGLVDAGPRQLDASDVEAASGEEDAVAPLARSQLEHASPPGQEPHHLPRQLRGLGAPYVLVGRADVLACPGAPHPVTPGAP